MMIFWLLLITVFLYLLLKGNLYLSFLEQKNSESIIKERLARGEISIAEYKHIKETIGGNKNEHY